MDQAATIKLIEQYILSKHGRHWLAATTVKPAWKYAFYNPVKKNSEGAVAIKMDATPLVIYGIFILFLSILFLVTRVLIPFYISILAIGLLAFIKYYYNSDTMVVNATGITFYSRTYFWKDYEGAFISYTELHKNRDVQLVLVDSTNQLTCINITDMGKWNTIGTAIRDFQPPEWRQ